MGISRVAVFKKIQAGHLKAERFGRNYLITRDSLADNAGLLTVRRQKELNADVRKIIEHYSEALKRLSKE